MSSNFQQMSVEEYAQLQSILGMPLVKQGDVYWRRVRPFFYRPLLSFQSYNLDMKSITFGKFRGFQYAVNDTAHANSTLNFLVVNPVNDYSLAKVSHNRRRLIKEAMKSFTIEEVVNQNIIKEQGHKVYLSFFERTQYQYKHQRLRESFFHQWVEGIFNSHKSLVLGGFDQQTLVAVSISFWLGDTILYSSFFSETNAHKQGVGELMFHRLREIAAQTPNVQEILVRPYQGGNGMDEYYLKRGCQIVRKPACLVLNPMTHLLLRSLLPKKYAFLCGKF